MASATEIGSVSASPAAVAGSRFTNVRTSASVEPSRCRAIVTGYSPERLTLRACGVAAVVSSGIEKVSRPACETVSSGGATVTVSAGGDNSCPRAVTNADRSRIRS